MALYLNTACLLVCELKVTPCGRHWTVYPTSVSPFPERIQPREYGYINS
jgi:hypothetical protein